MANGALFGKARSAVLLLMIACSLARAETALDLPEGAFVIETQPVREKRALVLWMLNPEKHPRDAAEDTYTCPEYTRGHCYSGKTRLSLIDSETRKVINTIPIKGEEGEDFFEVPYWIKRFYYKVPKLFARDEGEPLILDLQDFNGDGKAHEFALFDAMACMGLRTMLFGYSEKQDKAIQYHIAVTAEGKTKDRDYLDYLFSKKPVSPGVWKYEIDYRGRGGSLDRYSIHYDKTKERFAGSLEQIWKKK